MSPPSPTGLTRACHENNMEQVKGILKAPRHCWEARLDDALLEAVENSNRPLIQLLLAKGARFRTVSFGRLCYKADLEVIQDVFGPEGLDVNTTEYGGGCALRLAVRRIDVIEWLLARGADPNLLGDRDTSPLAAAVAGSLCDSVDVLLAHGAALESGILHKALWVSRRHPDDLGIVKHIIGKGVNVNEVAVLRTGPPRGPNQPERGTPLHSAAKLNLVEAARLLLDAGADPNLVVDGKTPLQLAKSEGKLEVCELLSSLATQTAPNPGTVSS